MCIAKLKSAEVDFEWSQVLEGEKESYDFPSDIMDKMRGDYEGPAIYRWNIFKKTDTGFERYLYIGECGSLIERIREYSRPQKDQKTNIRIHKELKCFIAKGFEIRMEKLTIKELKITSLDAGNLDLKNKRVRGFVEALLIVYYDELGFNLLNK